MSVAHLVTIRDGKVARFEVIPDLLEGMQRAGLADDNKAAT